MTMSTLQSLLRCCSVILNAVCAGGIFTFPLMSPVLSEHLKLTQPQLTTIALAGMMSQYTVASVVGKVIDTRGPALCSLISAGLFTFAYGGFAATTYFYPETPSASESLSIFRNLTLAFFLAGVGTVFGYFSSLFAASRFFPNHTGIASGGSMALFGLSPLFLSVIASNWFTDPTTDTLNVTRFTAFLAVFCGSVYLLGALALRIDPLDIPVSTETPAAEEPRSGFPDETTTLLPDRQKLRQLPGDGSIVDLARQSDFWLIAVFCLLTLGASEMIISNIGTIVLSLPPYTIEQTGGSSAQAYTSRQVKLLSLSNTISRITVGVLADFISPVASYLPCGARTFPRKHRITRIAFLSLSSLMLASTFIWMNNRVLTRDDIWTLSIGTGMGYSAVFTVLPSIISSIWGMPNLGRNFGIMMYAPFVGNPLFSYVYAFVSESHASGNGVCQGRECWQSTFTFAVVTSLVALVISFELWRRWKKHL
ncbi:MFS general substrate transporter [Ephemerocybe angulata]|uniref:MFS general substrate transporter n=1 Tax=Ephemerocybe angulata TaxID=980116 RepID=A0A8H6IGB2_9AGAR|nr:MFS general substrate transporter [Tulosesus angulatus]